MFLYDYIVTYNIIIIFENLKLPNGTHSCPSPGCRLLAAGGWGLGAIQGRGFEGGGRVDGHCQEGVQLLGPQGKQDSLWYQTGESTARETGSRDPHFLAVDMVAGVRRGHWEGHFLWKAQESAVQRLSHRLAPCDAWGLSFWQLVCAVVFEILFRFAASECRPWWEIHFLGYWRAGNIPQKPDGNVQRDGRPWRALPHSKQDNDQLGHLRWWEAEYGRRSFWVQVVLGVFYPVQL